MDDQSYIEPMFCSYSENPYASPKIFIDLSVNLSCTTYMWFYENIFLKPSLLLTLQFYRLLYPSSLNFMQSLHYGNEGSMLAVTEGCQVEPLYFYCILLQTLFFSYLLEFFSFICWISVANYMGLENERKWWLCTTNMWFPWWCLLRCLQFFNWKHCSWGSWSYSGNLWSSQVGIIWFNNYTLVIVHIFGSLILE